MDHHATSAFPFDICLGARRMLKKMQGLVGRDMCFMVVLPGGTLTFVTWSKSAFCEALAPGFPTGFSLRLSRASPEVATYPTWIILVSQVLALNPARKTNNMYKPSISRPVHTRSPHRLCAPWTSHCYPDTMPQRQLRVRAGPGMHLGTHIFQALKR